MEVANKKVAVLGMGPKTIMPLLDFLLKKGCQVLISEQNDQNPLVPLIKAKGGARVQIELGQHSKRIYQNQDLIILSPGVPADLDVLNQARQMQVPIYSELELAYQYTKAPFIAVTGTNGKSTVATLLGHIFQAANLKTIVAGNIGIPLIKEAPYLTAQDIIIAEVSSFQLELIENFRPQFAVILNITPDHLNRHYSMENYINIKANIFAKMQQEDNLFLNADDDTVVKLSSKAKAKVYFYSLKQKSADFFVQQQVLIDGLRNRHLFKLDQLSNQSNHFVSNCLAAIAVSTIYGLDDTTILKGLKNFKGLPHVFEEVSNYPVTYINDSKGTNPAATAVAIKSIADPLILILGGQKRNADFTLLAQLIKKRQLKKVIICGENAYEIISSLQKVCYQDYQQANTLKEAVSLAVINAELNDTVLFSPAAASWDQYTSYIERGEDFKKFLAEKGVALNERKIT